jgi:hypothetical protein
MIRSKFLTPRKIKTYISICLVALVSFWLVDKGPYYYRKYRAARKIYKQYNQDVLGQISAYFPKGSVVVAPAGGLGNQLFQYSAGYNLAKQTGSKLYVLTSRGKKNQNIKENTSIYDRNFALHNFIPTDQIVFREDITSDPTKLQVEFVNDQNFFQLKNQKNNGLLYTSAYFESEIYFEEIKDEIRSVLSLKDEDFAHLNETLKKVSDQSSYCVHMRKGDMLRTNYQYFLSPDYQREAINLVHNVTDKPKFFVFSDSPEVAKRELHDDKIEFFSYKQLEDFWLMSHCANNVIANSTFSWWAAYLNKNESKTVIAPYHRYHNLSYYYLWENKLARYSNHRLYENSAYPKDWILLDHEKHDLIKLVKENVPAAEQAEILKDYKEKPFNIYSGQGVELSLCKNEQDSKYHICKTDHGKNLPTVVTAYFKVKNKHTDKEFDSWIRKFLSVPNNLIVFTDKQHAGLIKKMRGDLPIIIIEKNLKDLYHYKYYDRYKEMHEIEKAEGYSPELYIIQSEKVKFVNEAIKLDPYKSNFFVWTDIGAIKENQYLDIKYPTNTHMVSNKMSFFAINDFMYSDVITKAPRHSYDISIAGNVQIGDKFAWKLYNHLWDTIIESYLEKSFMITNDQAVIGAIILTYPEIARIIYPDIRYTGNLWWYSLLYLSDSEKTQE